MCVPLNAQLLGSDASRGETSRNIAGGHGEEVEQCNSESKHKASVGIGARVPICKQRPMATADVSFVSEGLSLFVAQ